MASFINGQLYCNRSDGKSLSDIQGMQPGTVARGTGWFIQTSSKRAIISLLP